MAKIRTTSVINGDKSYKVASITLLYLPLLPPSAVFTYFKYLKTFKAYFTSSKIIICNKREQINLIAVD